MNDRRPLLTVDNLTIAYDGKAVVDAATFALSPHRCLGVIGESGAGKTQIFMALMGLLPTPARVSGTAQLGEIGLLDGAGASVRGREVAMIFQDPMTALTPHLRIGDQVAEPLVAHRGMSWRDARLRAAQLLDQVRMPDVPRRLRQYPHELSGGMRQRAMIAMALACDPKLLIADEPTSALDVSVQAQLLSLLRELMRERGMALALVTHDMGVIAALADDVLVMRAGKILERGPVQTIFAAPAHAYTRGLLAATPRIETPGPGIHRLPAALPPLTVRGLSVHHRLRGGWPRAPRVLAAVDDVSFEVGDGEALGIVGESGCGKSTLTRALLQLGAPFEGEIVWLGAAVQGVTGQALRALRAGMQIVFQDPFASLDPRMRVGEIVAEPLRALRPGLSSATRSERVARVLSAVGLDADYARRYSHELSGGQCQRVAIARAMVLAPKLLVCDEAVSALDVSIQAQILDLVAALKREQGTSVIFVSHNLAVVRGLCERVLVMYLGKIVEAGPTEAVFATPRHPYTRMLLEAVPLLDPARERARETRQARGEAPSALDRPGGCRFRTRCPAAQPACAAVSPGMEEAGNSHQVACLRWRDLTN